MAACIPPSGMAGTAGKLRRGCYSFVVGSDPTACAVVMRLAGTVAALVLLTSAGASSALGIDFTRRRGTSAAPATRVRPLRHRAHEPKTPAEPRSCRFDWETRSGS